MVKITKNPLVEAFQSSMTKFSLTIIFVFAALSVYSICVYKDFGMYTDQHNNPRHLRVTLKKYFHTLGLIEKAPKLVQTAEDFETYPFKYYGVSQQYPLTILEYLSESFKLSGQKYWQTRHLYVRIIFLLAGLFFYFILKRITNNKIIILVGLFLFFLHPRISAHSFYNMRDSVFLSFFTISIYYLTKAIQKTTTPNIVVLAIISAITANVRMMGVLIPIYFCLWLLWTYKAKFREALRNIVFFFVGFSVTSVLIWPLLWDSPINTFFNAFMHFSNYTSWKGTNIFNGQLVSGDNLPVSYVPVWIAISSPYAHLITFLMGLTVTSVFLWKGKLEKNDIQLAIPCLFFIFSSYLAIIVFRSTLYGDWRHLYYLFTPLLLLGLIGLKVICFKYSKLFILLITLILLSLGSTVRWMIVNHPHYYVYFNSIAAKDWNKKWDGDTWHLSTKHLLDKVLDQDAVNGKRLRILRDHSVVAANLIFSVPQRKKMEIVKDVADADYILGSYRNIIGEYPTDHFKGFKEYLSITVDGIKIKTIFKRENKE